MITCIMDMDGTITPTPHSAHGKYLPLQDASTHDVMLKYIRAGHRLVAISTGGHRMLKQLYEPLKEELAKKAETGVEGRFILAMHTGGVIFYTTPDGKLVEDTDFRLKHKTCFQPQHINGALDLLRQVILKIFAVMAEDETYLPTLSKKYHEPFKALLKQRAELGADKFNESILSLEKLKTHGAFLTETKDALLDCQTVPGDENVLAHVNILGVPMKRFGDIFTPDILDTLKTTYGVTGRAQPNSVAIAVEGLDKSTALKYFSENKKSIKYLSGFDLASSLSFGDNPQSVDAPLAQFPPCTFVSVSNKLLTSEEKEKFSAPIVEVGGEENGTKVAVEVLLEVASSATAASGSAVDPVKVVQATVEKLKSVPRVPAKDV